MALAVIAGLLVGGCMSRPPRHDRSGEVSYNRRELPPEPGLFTGPDGAWTVYDSTSPSDCPAPADEEHRTRGEDERCDAPAEER